MPIPQFDENGLLPNGVHDCTVNDIQVALTWNQHRLSLFQQFSDFLENELRPLFDSPVYFDGSFVTNKDEPDDTDIVLDLSNVSDAEKWIGIQFMMSNQSRLKDEYRVHFWVNLPGGNDFAAFFQYVGVKTAKLKGLDPFHQKGILRLQ